MGAHRIGERASWRRSLYGGGGMQIPLRDSRLALRADVQAYLLSEEAVFRLGAGFKYAF